MQSLNLEKCIGVCVKNNDGLIIERNHVATITCGHYCDQFCLVKLKEARGEILDSRLTGFNLFPKIKTKENKLTDVVVTIVEDKITTMLYPLDEKIEVVLKKYENYNLTPSEFKIVTLLLKGYSNKSIADLLFISKSTLKKHLNNIYKKLPLEIRPR